MQFGYSSYFIHCTQIASTRRSIWAFASVPAIWVRFRRAFQQVFGPCSGSRWPDAGLAPLRGRGRVRSRHPRRPPASPSIPARFAPSNPYGDRADSKNRCTSPRRLAKGPASNIEREAGCQSMLMRLSSAAAGDPPRTIPFDTIAHKAFCYKEAADERQFIEAAGRHTGRRHCGRLYLQLKRFGDRRWECKKPYAVIDNEGDVVARFRSYDSAIDYANANGYSTTWLNLDQLQKLRENGSPE